MFRTVVFFAIGFPEVFAADAGLNSENDRFGNDGIRGEVKNDTVVQDALDRNMTGNRLSSERYHRSGVPFPSDILHRFQLDLAGQKKFPRTRSSWGPRRPQMPRAIEGESRDRQHLQSAAMFWNTVRIKGAVTYAHHHHPDWKGHDGHYGIDCSNFVAYLYNLVLGVEFTSDITALSKLKLRHVTNWADLEPGDVALFSNMARTGVTHTGIIVKGEGNPSVVHSHGSGPQLASRHNWWPIDRFAYGFRLQDLIASSEQVLV